MIRIVELMATSHSGNTTFIRSIGRIGGVRRIGKWVVIAAVLAAVLFGFTSRGTADPQTDAAPDTEFSAARASEATADLVDTPRPIGSVDNAETRKQLAEALQDAGFDVDTREATGARTLLVDEETESRAGFTRNLIATRQGSDPTGTIVLATHIDSVNGAPGAADAGIGLSVILESLRALGDEAQRNDIAVLLVDGEEDLMLGSKALVESKELDLAEPVVVLNHEARGTSGRPVVTRWSGPMHTVLPGMPAPEAASFTDALFEFIPNDTDFTEYRKAGWWGLDMAITGASWAYHTPQDDSAHLDQSTLQHYGDMTLALTQDLLDTDLGTADEESASPVLVTAPWGIVALSPLILRLLAVVGLGLVVAGAMAARRRKLVTWGSVALGALAGVLTLVVGAGLAVALWAGASALKPDMLSIVISEPFRSWPFFLAEVAVAFGAAWLGWSIIRRWLSSLAIGLGWSVCAVVLSGALTIFSPGLGGWLLLPVAIATLGLLASILLTGFAERSPRHRALQIAIAAVTTVPMGWVFGAQFSVLREFGIASSNGMLAGVVVLSIFAIAPVLIVSAGAGVGAGAGVQSKSSSARRFVVPAGILVLAIALSGVGLWANAASDEPIQESVTAKFDADTATTTWEASGATQWGRDINGTTSDAKDLQAPRCVCDDDAQKDSAAGDLAADDSAGEGPGQRMTITASSPRDAARMLIEPVKGTMRDIVVDGTKVPGLDESDSDSGKSSGSGGSTRLMVTGLEAGQKAQVSFTPSAEVTALECSDETDDLSVAAGWKAPAPGSVSLVQPVVRVTKTLTL